MLTLRASLSNKGQLISQNIVSSIRNVQSSVEIMHADSSRLSDSSSMKFFLRCMMSKLCFHPWKSGSSGNVYMCQPRRN